jgi:hypothetical protein
MGALDFSLRVVLFVVDTATWLILARVLVQPLIRNPKGAFWQVFLIATEPVFRVSRLLSAGRVPERWIWLVSLAWLMAVRIVVKLQLRP